MMEGQTERVFLAHLREFLELRLEKSMPKLFPDNYHGRIPTNNTLKRRVELLLSDPKRPADGTPTLSAQELTERLMALNRPSAPYVIDQGQDENVDLIAELEPGRRFTLLDMVRLENRLHDLLGMKVDLSPHNTLR